MNTLAVLLQLITPLIAILRNLLYADYFENSNTIAHLNNPGTPKRAHKKYAMVGITINFNPDEIKLVGLKKISFNFISDNLSPKIVIDTGVTSSPK